MPLRLLEFPRDEKLLRRTARTILEPEFGQDALLERATALAYMMRDRNGVGLAHAQVVEEGREDEEPLRMFAMQRGRLGYEVFCNPVILERGPARLGPEACLSFASVQEFVQAPEWVRFNYTTPAGEPRENVRAVGFEARIVAHEVAHLAGRLLIDRMTPMKRSMFVRDVAKRRETTQGGRP